MEKDRLVKRIVVTGAGVVTSLGCDLDSFWNNLLSGKSGVQRVSQFDPECFPSQIGSEVLDFDPTRWMEPKEVRRNDRYTQYAMAASKMAIEDSGINISLLDKERFGVLIGSGIGGMQTIENQMRNLINKGPRKVSPFTIPSLIANIASGVVAIEFGAMGPNFSIVSACSSSTHAIGESMRILKNDEADIIVAGGSEASITQIGYAGFCSMKAMSTSFNNDPERASRPFDANRDGFVMGEGSGILILETLEHAIARNASIYCEIVGYAASCDAYHITSPHPDGKGLSLCLQNSLKSAGLKPNDINYINAHGTSTHHNDKFETKAIKDVFGEDAYNIPISSTKSMTGHLLGAAGSVEAIATIKAIQTGDIPPTINYENADPDCDLNYVPNIKTKADVKIAMSNNLGFGGQNASLIFKAYDEITPN